MSRALSLQLESVTRRFGAVVALENVSLEVYSGEILGILGPSGCGKTTLLNLIAGHIRPDLGSVTIEGRVVASGDTWVTPQDRRVAMVFQDYALFPHLTAVENVCFALPKAQRKDAAARGRELLAVLDVEELAERRPTELSGGQQQRVALARALAQEPELVLLDEPFASLDQTTRDEVRTEIIGRLRETGLTCIFVTHDQEEALSISDRVAVMHAGQILQVDEPEVLYRKPFCSEVADFMGRANVVEGVGRGDHVDTALGAFALLGSVVGPVRVFIRPELVGVARDQTGSAVVESRDFRGHDVVYGLRLSDGSLTWSHRPSIDMVEVGDRVRIDPQPGHAALVPVAWDTPPT